MKLHCYDALQCIMQNEAESILGSYLIAHVQRCHIKTNNSISKVRMLIVLCF